MLKGIDVVLQYERIEDDLHALLQKIGLINEGEKIKLAYMKQTPEKRNYQTYYSPSFRILIERIYSKELALFGYTFNGIDDRYRIASQHRNFPALVNEFTRV